MNEQISEEELSNRINSAIRDLEFKRGNGVTLEKSHYIGHTIDELEKELSKLKSPKSRSDKDTDIG